MFSVESGGVTFSELTAREALTKARLLRRTGLNDVRIFRSDGSRISQYALDQIVRLGGEKTTAP
jgi:hypothetical protein